MHTYEHGGNVYDEDAPDGERWLDFSANICPSGIPESVLDAIEQHIPDLENYPDPNARKLKKAIALEYDIPEAEIVPGNGATELLYLFFHVVRPASVLLVAPSFSEYERAARACGADIEYYGLDAEEGFKIDFKDLAEDMEDEACLVLGNPNNPTGNIYTAEELHPLIDIAEERGTWLLIDESFLDFREDASLYTVKDMVAEHSHLIVIQSLTKFYAIPGLRLVFAVMPTALADEMCFGKDPWNVNLLAQVAGAAALADKEYQTSSKELIAREGAFLYRELSSIDNIRVMVPTVNFILIDLHDTDMPAESFANAMKSYGILVRDCSNFPGLDRWHIRVAVKRRTDNLKLIAAMKEVLA